LLIQNRFKTFNFPKFKVLKMIKIFQNFEGLEKNENSWLRHACGRKPQVADHCKAGTLLILAWRGCRLESLEFLRKKAVKSGVTLEDDSEF
jgi:hypothetical protein